LLRSPSPLGPRTRGCSPTYISAQNQAIFYFHQKPHSIPIRYKACTKPYVPTVNINKPYNCAFLFLYTIYLPVLSLLPTTKYSFRMACIPLYIHIGQKLNPIRITMMLAQRVISHLKPKASQSPPFPSWPALVLGTVTSLFPHARRTKDMESYTTRGLRAGFGKWLSRVPPVHTVVFA
jgi:hypothetical protein